MAEQPTLSTSTIVSQGDEQVSTIVDGETVLMNVTNGKYFQLDDIGSRIWSLIETPTAISAICDRLVQEFEVDRATCEGDVVKLLGALAKHNLAKVAAGA